MVTYRISLYHIILMCQVTIWEYWCLQCTSTFIYPSIYSSVHHLIPPSHVSPFSPRSNPLLPPSNFSCIQAPLSLEDREIKMNTFYVGSSPLTYDIISVITLNIVIIIMNIIKLDCVVQLLQHISSFNGCISIFIYS